MKFIVVVSALILSISAFAQVTSTPKDIQTNCSSADQNVSVQLLVNSQQQFKSLLINDHGNLRNVSVTQLNGFYPFHAVYFTTDKENESGTLLIDSSYDSFGNRQTPLIGKYWVTTNPYIAPDTVTLMICMSEVK
jgi:hypothetical protein